MGVDVGDLTQEQLRALADLGEQMRFAVWYTGEPLFIWVRTNSAGSIRTMKLAPDGTFSDAPLMSIRVTAERIAEPDLGNVLVDVDLTAHVAFKDCP